MARHKLQVTTYKLSRAHEKAIHTPTVIQLPCYLEVVAH